MVNEFQPTTLKTKSQRLNDSQSLSLLIERLLKAGVEVNHHDENGETPLMTVIRSSLLGATTAYSVLAAGAHVNARKQNGESVLHIALLSGNIEATEAILAKGANVDAIDGHGVSVLGKAARVLKDSLLTLDQYGRTKACMALAIKAGALHRPENGDDFTLSNRNKSLPTLPTSHYSSW